MSSTDLNRCSIRRRRRTSGGTLTDSSIATLLRELAAPGWEGLCLITTRVPVAGITAPDSDAAAIQQLDLRNLDIRSGVSLLESLIGRQQNTEEAEQAVAAVHGHALAVNLLGRYLRDAHGGRISGRFGIERLSGAVADGGHAQRIMELYAEWLRQYGRLGELAILDVIGLFDRPAPFPAIAAVLAGTDLGQDMPDLSEFDGPEWQRRVADLRRMGLLADETAGLPGTLDAHPLVREYFRDRLRHLSPALWEAGNLSLYRYYRQRAPEQPANAADMNLLYAAVNHGCTIGRHQEVYDQILVTRIWRSPRESYSTRILGMTGSEIVALSNYFQLPAWTRLRRIKLARPGPCAGDVERRPALAATRTARRRPGQLPGAVRLAHRESSGCGARRRSGRGVRRLALLRVADHRGLA